MSLSFVKSAVLSSTDGVSHNEETTIDNQETQSVRASSHTHKPLFEQLRANKDARDERDEEFQRSLRGARPLDEEDCAHLDAVELRREELEREVRGGIEREVALFRAAREDRGLAQTVAEGGSDDGGGGGVGAKARVEPATKKEARKMIPKFTIKKKRKRIAQESKSSSDTKQKVAAQKVKSNETFKVKGNEGRDVNVKKLPSKAVNDSDSYTGGGGLLGLGCYGSDSD